jgi:hypothetical protein
MVFTSRELGGNISESLAVSNSPRVNLIPIPPLTTTYVQDWLQLTLFPLARGSGNKLMDLAICIQAKTLGNPHHVREFLKIAELKGHIYMNRIGGGWDWSIDDLVCGVSMAENVVEFMLEKMRELPRETLILVQYASCLGDLFDYTSLSDVTGIPKDKVIELLWPAAKEGILISSVKVGIQLRRNTHYSLDSGDIPTTFSSPQLLSRSSSSDNLDSDQILNNRATSQAIMKVEVFTEGV